MNDRFKFRSWHEPTKTMEYNGLWTGRDWDKKLSDCNFKLMQCTGLKDKNGKLIYEGDILQENWHKYILKWANGAYVIKDIKRGTSYMFTSGMCIHKSEVIGNIYENVNLLESEE